MEDGGPHSPDQPLSVEEIGVGPHLNLACTVLPVGVVICTAPFFGGEIG
jgi:hypothetical protein